MNCLVATVPFSPLWTLQECKLREGRCFCLLCTLLYSSSKQWLVPDRYLLWNVDFYKLLQAECLPPFKIVCIGRTPWDKHWDWDFFLRAAVSFNQVAEIDPGWWAPSCDLHLADLAKSKNHTETTNPQSGTKMVSGSPDHNEGSLHGLYPEFFFFLEIV